MALIKGALDRSQFKVIQMKVLDGADEAVNSWQSANFMKVCLLFQTEAFLLALAKNFGGLAN